MIKGLFGNRNIEHVLFFLFVNERCYGAQLQSLLRLPLTPIQRALSRLEMAGVIVSKLEGKIRMYELNADFPLRWELEALLKKAYILLSADQKRYYCFIHRERLTAKQEWKREKEQAKQLQAFWERLLRVKTLSVRVKSRSDAMLKERTGRAHVSMMMPSHKKVIFHEQGTWLLNGKIHTQFRNAFQWTLDLDALLITLEHLRYGVDRPVFLFHLTSPKPHQLESVDAHLCGDDVYLGNISWNSDMLRFHWRTISPQKNEELHYMYS